MQTQLPTIEKISLVAPCPHNYAALDRSHVVYERIQGCHSEPVSEASLKCKSTLQDNRYVRLIYVLMCFSILCCYQLSVIISVLEPDDTSLAVSRAVLNCPSSLLTCCAGL